MPLEAADSPHARIARKLRFELREHRDIARSIEVNTICLSALSGNKSIDVMSSQKSANELLRQRFDHVFPYLKEKESPARKLTKKEYEEILNMLDDPSSSGTDDQEVKTGAENSDIIKNNA